MDIVPDPPISLGGSTSPPPLVVELNFRGSADDGEFLTYLKRSIRTRGGPPHIPATTVDEPAWVIVKGTPDSDTIQAVYGPYTEELAEWLLQNFANDSFARWTKRPLLAAPKD